MAATMAAPVDLSSSTGIEQYLRSREELADQVGRAAAGRRGRGRRRLARAGEGRAARRRPGSSPLEESLLERFERVTGRPLAQACPPRCSCRGVPVHERLPVG